MNWTADRGVWEGRGGGINLRWKGKGGHGGVCVALPELMYIKPFCWNFGWAEFRFFLALPLNCVKQAHAKFFFF